MVKKWFFYSLFLFFGTAVLAQTSSMNLSSEKGERFTLLLNGEKQNKLPVTKLKLKNLDAPFYKIKVIFAGAKSKPLQKTLTLEPGFESFYLIKKIGKIYKVVFISSAPVPGQEDVKNSLPGADSSSGKGSVSIDPSPKVKTAFIPGYVGQIGCPRPVGAIEFAALKKNVNAKVTEEDKQHAVKQLISTNCLLSVQVKELIMLFSFEKTRIEFAKMAYAHTYDIGNYNKVADAFMFEASANELNTFIKEKTR